jgi:Rps23 Pro-64 3,4-dihydroxylase Tpa1-like proline 4-hydroxylase
MSAVYQILDNFLDNNINEDILNWMKGLEWTDGKIRNRSKDGSIRTSKVYFGIEEDFKQSIIEKIVKNIPHIEGYEFQLTMNSDGNFYKPHPDTDINSRNKKILKRKFTLIYYLFNDPKPFLGGDLIIYNKHDTENYDKDNFVTISPKNNSGILFPSEYWHEVTPIQNDESIDNNRFTVNIWLH